MAHMNYIHKEDIMHRPPVPNYTIPVPDNPIDIKNAQRIKMGIAMLHGFISHAMREANERAKWGEENGEEVTAALGRGQALTYMHVMDMLEEILKEEQANLARPLADDDN